MPLEPALVAFALDLFRSSPTSSLEAKELALILDSREELFAYVLTNQEFLHRHPDVQDTVMKLAQEHGQGALSKRTAVGVATATRTIAVELEEALKDAITANSEGKLQIDRILQLDRRLALDSTSHHSNPERYIG